MFDEKFKFQITSTKSQISTKLQCPNDQNEEKILKGLLFGALVFGTWDLFVIWDLELGTLLLPCTLRHMPYAANKNITLVDIYSYLRYYFLLRD